MLFAQQLGGFLHAARLAILKNTFSDWVEALQLLPARPVWGRRLTTVATDKGYRGRFARHVVKLGLTHQVGSRPPSTRGFGPVANRWVVERTFAWLTGFRRLATHCQHDRVPQPLSFYLIS
ncbi:MAG: hypothetical protein EOO36_02175 [Cytophagaceae bacterium]|nr:MAG: hypothetical protein EOO36_02175 [Cytophagaceae bacterium]